MQPASESHQPHASAEERIAEQARETQQLQEQLARASVKEGPTLPPLSVPELNKETSGCPTLWGCSMVCIGKNIANCSKNPQFLPVMCALCPHCARAVHTRTRGVPLRDTPRPCKATGHKMQTIHCGGPTVQVHCVDVAHVGGGYTHLAPEHKKRYHPNPQGDNKSEQFDQTDENPYEYV